MYFNNTSIDEVEAAWLRGFVAALTAGRAARLDVIEFGPGVSTAIFLQAGCRVLSYETEEAYYVTVRDAYQQYIQTGQLRLSLIPNEPEIASHLPADERFDLAFVDGPYAGRQAPKHARWNSIKAIAAIRLSPDVMILHDANRRRERKILDHLAATGWKCQVHDIGPRRRGFALVVPAVTVAPVVPPSPST